MAWPGSLKSIGFLGGPAPRLPSELEHSLSTALHATLLLHLPRTHLKSRLVVDPFACLLSQAFQTSMDETDEE